MQVPRTPWSIPFPATPSTWLLSPRSQDGNHTSSEHAHVLRKVIREGLTRDFHSHFFGQNYTSCTTLAVKAAGQFSNFVFSLSGVKKEKGGIWNWCLLSQFIIPATDSWRNSTKPWARQCGGSSDTSILIFLSSLPASSILGYGEIYPFGILMPKVFRQL